MPAAEAASPAMAAPAANGDADESVAPLILQEFREALVAPEMTPMKTSSIAAAIRWSLPG